MSVAATVRFTVTVDVPIGSWNEEAKFSELREVAVREGTQKLRSQLQAVDFKLIGQPKQESGEVNQVLAKLIQTGGDPRHWSGDMVAKLVEELPDLLAALKVFVELNPVLHPHQEAMLTRFWVKVDRFRGWHFDTLTGQRAA